MTFAFTDGALVCEGVLAVDDAEQLLGMLAGRPGTALDLAACRHVHGACLQVLMATAAVVRAWPADARLAAWLRAALAPHHH
jgi:hypothetical protein